MIRKLTDEKSWFIDWIEEYSQFFQECNWWTFHPAYIEFENDKIMGGIEATFIIAGLGLRVRWNHTITPEMQECVDAMAEIEAGTAKTVPWREAKAEIMGDTNGQAQ